MARPKSDDRRAAILQAATRVILTRGISAPTAAIAQEAGVSNGSLFTYFPTKSDLFNQLYLELKTELATASQTGLPAEADLRDQLFHVWSNWTNWASSHRENWRALTHLHVSGEISQASHAAAQKTMTEIAKLMDRSRTEGPLRDAPMAFVVAIMNSMAEVTIDFMGRDSAHRNMHCNAGFDALWRAIT